MKDLRFDDSISLSLLEKQKVQKSETDLIDIIEAMKNAELELFESIEANLANELDDENCDLD